MDVGCPKKFGGSGDPAPLRWGVSDPLETRLSPTSVTAASLVVLGRAIFTDILWRILNFRILPSTIAQRLWNRHGSIGLIGLFITVP